MSLKAGGKAIAYQFVSFGVIALVLLVVSRIYPLGPLLHRLDSFIARHQPWSTACYPLVHALCNLLLLPAGVLVIGSGFLFGLWEGFALALTGHLLAAAGAFWISRTFGRRFVERHLASRPQWRELDQAIEREGWKVVMLSQSSPLLPTSLFNYCYGLTRLRFWPCMAWIALGWGPGMFLYAYLGRMGQVGWQVLSAGQHLSPRQYVVWGAGLAITLGVTVALGRVAFRLLREARAKATGTGGNAPVEAPSAEVPAGQSEASRP